MVGARTEGLARRPKASAKPSDAIAIKVSGLSGRSVVDVSFEVRRGEVLGLAALEGQGQRELLRILAGLDKRSTGEIELDGKPVQLGSPREALTGGSGIAFVPEERKTEGVFPGMTAASNISVSVLDRIARFGLILGGKERREVGEQASRVDLDKRYVAMTLRSLSGGNQQKALIGRVLISGARNLIMFDPTRGVDVGTKQVIHRVVRDFAASGGSVLIYSTEIPELVNLCDRCLVLYAGRVAGLLGPAEFSESRLVALATGHSLDAAVSA
jgi:ribose transport system ATP-binding protein